MSKELSKREINHRIAERLFGWKWWRSSSNGKRVLMEPDVDFSHSGTLADMTEEIWDSRNPFLPEYSSDISAAYAMEEKIKEMGLEKQYAAALLVELGITNSAYTGSPTAIMEIEEVFAIAHASAEDRCLAAVRVVE